MKLFLDTNVIIDVIASREPFVEDSRKVLSLCEQGQAEGVMSAITLCTISYVLRKFAAPGTLRRQIRDFRNLLSPVDLTAALLDRAISSTIADFEDAVQFYSAVYSDADYIITRNAKDFPQDSIPVLSPAAFLNLKELSPGNGKTSK